LPCVTGAREGSAGGGGRHETFLLQADHAQATLPSLEPKYSSSRTRITIPNRFGTQGSDSDGVEIVC
jgi:hypothetical protein